MTKHLTWGIIRNPLYRKSLIRMQRGKVVIFVLGVHARAGAHTESWTLGRWYRIKFGTASGLFPIFFIHCNISAKLLLRWEDLLVWKGWIPVCYAALLKIWKWLCTSGQKLNETYFYQGKKTRAWFTNQLFLDSFKSPFQIIHWY